MKKLNYLLGILSIAFVASVTFTSCSEDDSPSKTPAVTENPVIETTTGSLDFLTAEGILIDTDLISKVVELHGQPEVIVADQTSGGTAREFYHYPSKGFSVLYNVDGNNANEVTEIRFYGGPWSYSTVVTVDPVTGDKTVTETAAGGVQYPHEVGLGLSFVGDGFTMDDVYKAFDPIVPDRGTVEEPNTNTVKIAPSENQIEGQPTISQHVFVKDGGSVRFFFYSDDPEVYIGKKVLFIESF